MNAESSNDGPGWGYAVKFVFTPSVAATVITWHYTHDVAITYVALMTASLFAVVGAAFVQPPDKS